MFIGQVKIKETGKIEASVHFNELKDAEEWLKDKLVRRPHTYSWGRVLEARTIITLRPEITLVLGGDDE